MRTSSEHTNEIVIGDQSSTVPGVRHYERCPRRCLTLVHYILNHPSGSHPTSTFYAPQFPFSGGHIPHGFGNGHFSLPTALLTTLPSATPPLSPAVRFPTPLPPPSPSANGIHSPSSFPILISPQISSPASVATTSMTATSQSRVRMRFRFVGSEGRRSRFRYKVFSAPPRSGFVLVELRGRVAQGELMVVSVLLRVGRPRT